MWPSQNFLLYNVTVICMNKKEKKISMVIPPPLCDACTMHRNVFFFVVENEKNDIFGLNYRRNMFQISFAYFKVFFLKIPTVKNFSPRGGYFLRYGVGFTLIHTKIMYALLLLL